jgi:hypothetical protein
MQPGLRAAFLEGLGRKPSIPRIVFDEKDIHRNSVPFPNA